MSEQQGLIGSTLRYYQKKIVQVVEERFVQGEHTALVVASTGSGKTRTFMGIVERFVNQNPSLRVLFMVHRVQLLKQLEELLKAAKFDVGVVAGSLNRREFGKQFTLASYLSLIKTPASKYNLVIWDEAHRFAPLLDDSSSALSNWWRDVKSVNPKVKDIGFTATPYTANTLIYGDNKHFEDISYEIGMKELLKNGYLTELKSYAGGHKFDLSGIKTQNGDWATSDLVKLTANSSLRSAQVHDAIMKLNAHDRKCVVWQCITIEHCDAVAKELESIGETVAVIHSEQEEFEQDLSIEEFKQGKRRHLVFVSIVSEGFDHAPCDAIVLLRPTKSPVLYVQSVGRTLRIHSSKRYSLCLDYGHVVKNCGPIDFPFIRSKGELPEIHSKKKTIADLDTEDEPMIECQHCGHFNFVELEVGAKCASCFFDLWEQKQKERMSKLSSKADEYSQYYSDVCIKQIIAFDYGIQTKQNGHRVLEGNYHFTDGSIVYDRFEIEPNPPRLDVYRAGRLKKWEKRVTMLGHSLNNAFKVWLPDPSLPQLIPFAAIISGKKILETCGWQYKPKTKEEEQAAACSAEQTSLF